MAILNVFQIEDHQRRRSTVHWRRGGRHGSRNRIRWRCGLSRRRNGTWNLKRQLCSLESEHDVPLEPVQLERVETFRVPTSSVVLRENLGEVGSVWPQRLSEFSLRCEAIAKGSLP